MTALFLILANLVIALLSECLYRTGHRQDKRSPFFIVACGHLFITAEFAWLGYREYFETGQWIYGLRPCVVSIVFLFLCARASLTGLRWTTQDGTRTDAQSDDMG